MSVFETFVLHKTIICNSGAISSESSPNPASIDHQLIAKQTKATSLHNLHTKHLLFDYVIKFSRRFI